MLLWLSVCINYNLHHILVFLFRPTDSSAYKTIGKVIARRCIESGISSVYCDYEPEEGTKVFTNYLKMLFIFCYFFIYFMLIFQMDLLLKEAKKGGLSLEEAPVYVRPLPHSKGIPTKPWDIIP